MAGNIKQVMTSDEIIHDLEVDMTNYYDKSETDTLLSAKADVTSVYNKSETDLLLASKADNDDIYTKAQLDTLFDSKANVNTVYTKGETDLLLTGKADVSTTYTKTEVDNALLLKADANDVYPKSQTYNRTQTDDLLATKANTSSVYSKSDVDTLLAGKEDTGVAYTKAEADVLLGAKANSADVYTITQTDALLEGKASIDDSSTTSTVATWSADKLHTEFQNTPKLDSVNTFEVYQIINSSGIDTTDTPSETTWGDGISFGDKNNVRTAFIAPSQNTDGSVDLKVDIDTSVNPNGKILLNGNNPNGKTCSTGNVIDISNEWTAPSSGIATIQVTSVSSGSTPSNLSLDYCGIRIVLWSGASGGNYAIHPLYMNKGMTLKVAGMTPSSTYEVKFYPFD